MKPKLKYQKGSILNNFSNTFNNLGEHMYDFYVTGPYAALRDLYRDKRPYMIDDENRIIGFRGRPSAEGIHEDLTTDELNTINEMAKRYDMLNAWYRSPRAQDMAKESGTNIDRYLSNIPISNAQMALPIRDIAYTRRGSTEKPIEVGGLVTRKIDDGPVLRDMYYDPNTDSYIRDITTWDLPANTTTRGANINMGNDPNAYFHELDHASVIGPYEYQDQLNKRNLDKQVRRILGHDDKDEYERDLYNYVGIYDPKYMYDPLEVKARLNEMRKYVIEYPHIMEGVDLYTDEVTESDIQNLLHNISNSSKKEGAPQINNDLREFLYNINESDPKKLVNLFNKIVRSDKPDTSKPTLLQTSDGSNVMVAKKGGLLKPKIRYKVGGKFDRAKAKMKKEGLSGFNKPKRTPNHPTKSHAVMAKKGNQTKFIRFGQQGVSGAGSNPKSAKEKARRKSFKARHAKNIGDILSAATWANKVKW